jgi:hypothetical protein
MRNKALAGVAIAVAAVLRIRRRRTPTEGMRLDESASPAPHGLVTPEERPMFSTNERGTAFAMLYDVEDRKAVRSIKKPVALEETTPG